MSTGNPKRLRLLHRFAREEDGATMLTFGLLLAMLVGGAGIGMDIGVAKKTKSDAQMMADSLALEAASFWADHQRMPFPEESSILDGKAYPASAAGLSFGRSVDGDVKFRVVYDRSRRHAVVEAWGTTKTTLSAAFGYDRIDFRVSAIAELG